MDNKDYTLRWEFVEGAEILTSMPDADRQKVEQAIDALVKNPWPKEFGAKQLDGGKGKFTVRTEDEDDEITVLYRVNVFESTIELVRVKRRGLFRKTGEWLAGLTQFKPKGKS